MRRFILSIALVTSLCAGSGCAGLKDVNLLSTEEEVQLGSQISQQLEASEIKLYNDPEVAAYIDDLGQRLARNSDRADIPYVFKVVDTDEVNAFAVPGGYLYVNRGLIVTAENESELAGVIGHEIGHIVGRHSAEQISRQYGLGLLTSIILGNDPSALAQIAAGIAGTGALRKYGRDAELEADYFGVMETYRAGIDPNGIVTFFEKLLAMHDREPNALENFFSTHPPTGERIAEASAQIRKLPAKASLATDSQRFQAIKRKLPPIRRSG
jgi:predicted Zn-dependent protease